MTFSDEFDAHKLDRVKWLTRYYWGDKHCCTTVM